MADDRELDPVLEAAVPDGVLGYFVRAQLLKFTRKGGPTRLERFAGRQPYVLPGVFAVLVLVSTFLSPSTVALVIWVVVLAVLCLQSFALRLSTTAWAERHRGAGGGA